MSASTRSEIRALLASHGLNPRKDLGQHFLVDPNVIGRVVRVADVKPGDRVLEVGPGTGTLTKALADAGAKVTAIEIDDRFRPILEDQLAGTEVELVFADAMKVDYAQLLGQSQWKVVANLPYQVGTPLVLDWLRHHRKIEALTVMIQAEVGERLAAKAGDDAYGLPSVIAGLHSEVGLAFRVPPQVFLPAPRVDSVLVTMHRRETPEHAERAIAIAAAGFGQRRKMLRGSLAPVFDHPVASLEAAGIDPTRRAESLTPLDFLRLAEQ